MKIDERAATPDKDAYSNIGHGSWNSATIGDRTVENLASTLTNPNTLPRIEIGKIYGVAK
jgi:hypothetical protein